ncbi:MAG: penicillin-binding protein 1C [Prolixibacteraceae bacterium]|nr:penicillin-binding protein 1C [Prolixibacteraceae bacterium]
MIHKKYLIRTLLSLLALLLLAVMLAPLPRFNKPCSTVVLAADGQLLGARIAADGQWRFPSNDTVPDKFKTCIIQFEDQYFQYHPGINLFAIGRAMVQNIRAKKVISGGSTITMQVARMAGNGRKRTITNKLIEILSALKLKLLYSKKSILSLYASNAPFGGNLVGIDAACWRYFGHSASRLSWAEAATLAVLPNAPSLIFPGTNDQKLKIKRDKLLKKLLSREIIDSLDCELAIEENLPDKPFALPDHSFHLTERLKKSNSGELIVTGIHYQLQQQVVDLVREHSSQLASQHIFNASAIVIDVRTNQVRAYIGNSPANNLGTFNNQVDMISSPRSTGSILKPFLYAAMLSDGEMLPNTLLPDIPVYLSGYAPKNFDYTFHGAVPASQALSWSLNIPAIYMLKRYGIDRFLDKLKQFGFTSFRKSSDHYGLSLILGGGETSLWELCSAYSGFSRTLNNYDLKRQYYKENFEVPSLIPSQQTNQLTQHESVADADAVWFTFQALLEVNRPEGQSGWENFQSSRRVAWKTGTSFGFRDAWAIATTPDYVVGVWAGNSNGEGRPGLTGVTAAAPLLFNILNLLPESAPHPQPDGEINFTEVCIHSGYRLGKNCPESKTVAIPEKGLKTAPCPYCQSIKIVQDHSGQNKNINVLDEVKVEKWFVLPPAMEFYFRKYNPSYLSVPVNSISGKGEQQVMEFIYPGSNDKIYIPRAVDGKRGNVVFEVAHREASVKIFWHLDNQYIGTTSYIHQKALNPTIGQHLITLTDEHGNTLKRLFTILN